MAKSPLGESSSDQESGRPSPRNAEEPKGPRRAGSSAHKVRIADVAIRLFQENPGSFWTALPELANAIELHLQSGSRGRSRVPVFEGYMTEREREFKLNSLAALAGRYQTTSTLEAVEASRALALAAALGEHAQTYKGILLEIAQMALGLSLTSDKPEKITISKGKSEHHTFELVRGVTLSLAWDGALVAMRFDPIEYRRRQKALSFVGIAADSNTDVARNHDAYLWTTPDER